MTVLADPLEEGWPSMDLCAEMLLEHLPEPWRGNLARPAFRRVVGRAPWLGRSKQAQLADRLLNRFIMAPREIGSGVSDADAYHIVDHTYAHLADRLPRERTGVYCHDLDAFRSIIEPARDRKPAWFRRLVRRQLSGLQRAKIVFHNSLVTREEILRHGLVAGERLVHAPLGVAPEFCPEGPVDGERPRWLTELDGCPYLLHIGSCIPRKRIDVLLDVAAGVRQRESDVQLLKVGGEWTPQQRDHIERLGLGPHITLVPQAHRVDLAHAYRCAAAVLVPSESEGYGLPVIEALACGAPVVASDLPVLREVGREGCLYAPVADKPAWVEGVLNAINNAPGVPGRVERRRVAARHSWTQHAEIVAEAYGSAIE